MNKSKIIELDVRPILSGGTDPFDAIMEKLDVISNDETLLIINTFEPIPLLNKLKTQGYTYKIERPADGTVHTFVKKTNAVSNEKEISIANVDLTFTQALEKFAGKTKEIDVRDLEMPMPMVTILEEVEQLKEGNALYVHHKRLPQYLIPELETRNFVFVKEEIDSENIKLIIFKK